MSSRHPGRLVGNGKYELASPLGDGAEGSVWLARHLALDRFVALKFLGGVSGNVFNAHARFLSEARTASLLRHQNAVRILDYGSDDGEFWLVMEFLSGMTLAAALAAARPLTPTRAIAIATQMLAALAEAHEYGIVHRDLTPADVMLVPAIDDDGRAIEQVKILDSGLASLFASAGSDIDAPEYTSPEQIAGATLDPRSDVYVVGVLLYEMLVGQVPFRGATAANTLHMHVERAPKAPASINPAISGKLERLVLKALSKDPAARFETSRVFRAALLALPEARGISSKETPKLRNAPTAPGVPRLGAKLLELPAVVGSALSLRSRKATAQDREVGDLVFAPRANRVSSASLPVVAVPDHDSPLPSPLPGALPATRARRPWALIAAALVLIGVGLGPLLSSSASPIEREASPRASTTAQPIEPTRVTLPTTQTTTVAPTSVATTTAVATPSATREPVAQVRHAPAAPVAQVAPLAPAAPAAQTPVAVSMPVVAPSAGKATRPVARPVVRVADHAGGGIAIPKTEPAPDPANAPAVATIPTAPPVEAQGAASAPSPEPATKFKPRLSLAASVEVQGLVVEGSLPRSSIVRSLDAARPALERCYRVAAQGAQRDVGGEVNASIVIDTDGQPIHITISAFVLPGFSSCAQQVLARARTRERPDTGSARASFSLAVTPVELP